MSSLIQARTLRTNRWGGVLSLAGAFVWTVLATAAGARRAPLGVIELLLLFAVLVILPLGLALIEEIVPSSGVFRVAGFLQPFAAVPAVVSMLLPPGIWAAVFVLPWLMVGLLIAVSGTIGLLQKIGRKLIWLVIAVAGADLVLASAWLVISRLALRPLGFQEPIILLTAVHFHYNGFATALIAACLLECSASRGLRVPGLSNTALLVVFLPFVVAVGFTFSAALQTVSAIALAASVAVLAAIQLWLTFRLDVRFARIFLRFASVCVLAGMTLASLYVIGKQTGRNWLTIPAMACTHGVLNGLGFVLLSLLGWLVEFHAQVPEPHEAQEEEHEDRNHRRHGLRWTPSGAGTVAARTSSDSHHAPDRSPRPSHPAFIARGFYDK